MITIIGMFVWRTARNQVHCLEVDEVEFNELSLLFARSRLNRSWRLIPY
jgi:hypothetical protein